jgi:hypothetical protein
MGSRVRVAVAASLVACGLLAGGAGASLAFADPPLTGDHHTDHSGGDGSDHRRYGSGEKPKSNLDEKKTTSGVGPRPGGTGSEHSGDLGSDKVEQTGKEPEYPKPGDEKRGGDDRKNGDNGNGGNPGNGNCGNSGSNGNAGCGRGNGNSDPDDPPTTEPTSTPTKEEPPPPSEEPGECDDKNKDHCSPGWPFPWPWPWNPGEPPGSGGDGGGGAAPQVPSGRTHVPPHMQLPPKLMPPATEPGPIVVDAEPGVGIAAAQLPIAPITLPVIVAPATGFGGGGGSPGAPTSPLTPRGVTAEPPAGREPLPANVGSNVAVPATSYRIGYTEYLRSAGLSQVAALAVPGLAGMLVLTGAGGLVGYRQARAGHAVHTSGTARFVN